MHERYQRPVNKVRTGLTPDLNFPAPFDNAAHDRGNSFFVKSKRWVRKEKSPDPRLHANRHVSKDSPGRMYPDTPAKSPGRIAKSAVKTHASGSQHHCRLMLAQIKYVIG